MIRSRAKQRIAWGPSEIVATGEFHGVNIGHRAWSKKGQAINRVGVFGGIKDGARKEALHSGAYLASYPPLS